MSEFRAGDGQSGPQVHPAAPKWPRPELERTERPTADQKLDEPRRPRRPRREEDKSEAERGPLTPTQFEDDGWGDLPVQMRD